MSAFGQSLEDTFGPVRDQYVVHFLRSARRFRTGASDLQFEPTLRGPSGAVLRFGQLDLPARADFFRFAEDDPSPDILSVENYVPVTIDPITLVTDKRTAISIRACSWNALEIRFASAAIDQVAYRMRLWYLEHFLSRNSPEPGGMRYALHSLNGPCPTDTGFRTIIDMGSAPISALYDLLMAMDDGGAVDLRIGTPDVRVGASI